MRKLLVICGVILLVLLPVVSVLGCQPQAETPTPSPTPTPAPAPTTMAEFEVVSLSITPPEAIAGETVNVTAEVKNIGGKEGVYTALLIIDGVEVEAKDIVVAPASSEQVIFILSMEKLGTYHIELGGLTGTLNVSYICGPMYDNPQTYRVIRTFTVKNETAGVDLLKVWMPTVVDWDSQGNIVTVETIPPPNRTWEDPQSGAGVLYWEFYDKPSKGSSLTILDQFTYTCYEINYNIRPEQITAYNKDSPLYVRFTSSEKYLQANDPEIIETAVSLAGDETNSYVIASSIYEWVIGHMKYRLIEGLGGARFAFKNGYGECGDYSALFVALCRAAGIPARPIIGRWATSKVDDWHVWAEFYLSGYGWIPVDPTIADVTGKSEDYFGHLDNKRLIFNKAYNIILHPEPYFFASQVELLQTHVWEFHGQSGVIQVDLNYSITPIASD